MIGYSLASRVRLLFPNYVLEVLNITEAQVSIMACQHKTTTNLEGENFILELLLAGKLERIIVIDFLPFLECVLD